MNDLISLKRQYDMYKPFIAKLKEILDGLEMEWNMCNIIFAIQCIDRNDWNIEHYLFTIYGERFISELYLLGNDPSK